MSNKTVQFRRGTTLQTEAFSGALGELTVDTDKHTVVVHDGFKLGGFPLKVEADEYARTRYLTYRAAIVQQGIASLGFSSPENSPEPIAIPDSSGIITGAARFSPTIVQSIQDHFMLPDGWVGPLTLDIVWMTEANIGTVGWQLDLCNLHVGELLSDRVFAVPALLTHNTSMEPRVFATSTINIPGADYRVNDELFFRLTRLIGSIDTITEPVYLISLRFTVLIKGK